MSKSLYSRPNKIYLDKLRKLRETRELRQADLGRLLGRSQGWVSYVEGGATTLNIIELREWLTALGVEFMDFLQELDAELRSLEALRLRSKPRRLASRGALGQVAQSGLTLDKASSAPLRSSKAPKRQVR